MPEERPDPIVYPRDAVVTREQMAAMLQISADALDASDLPSFGLGAKGKAVRYRVGQVLDALDERASRGGRIRVA